MEGHRRELARGGPRGMDTLLLELDTAAAALSGAATRDADGAPAVSRASKLGTAFWDVAGARADHPAVATKAGDFSYGWLRRAADGVRRYLCGRPGHAAGARVALQLANSPKHLAAFYGTLLAAGVVVPLPVGLERRRRQEIHALCRPDVLISRRQDINSREHESATATLRLGGGGGEEVSAPPRRLGNDLAMLLFTSGSTGTPKGVMLSHRNLLANAGQILHDLPIRAEDRSLVIVPFCHALGNSVLQTHVLAGATLLLGGALTFPATIVETLRELAATSFSAVPEVYGMLLKYGRLGEEPLPALRYMAGAGGELRHDLAADIADRIAPAAFHVMYGQSEATARLASLPPDEFRARRGSIGKPIRGGALAILDA